MCKFLRKNTGKQFYHLPSILSYFCPSMKKITLFIFLLLFLLNRAAFAQCAICKAVVESADNPGGELAKGVNNGILYLMAVPYILLFVIGYLIYRHFKRQKQAEGSL